MAIAQTASEAAAKVVPKNLDYEPGNVLRYGALGDGAADDTRAIADAIKANGSALFPSGVFVTDTIVLEDGAATNLVSDQKATLRLKANASTGRLIWHDGEGLVDRLELSGLIVDGNHAQQSVMDHTIAVHVRECRVYACTFTNCQKTAMALMHVAEFADISGNIFRDGKEHTGTFSENTVYVLLRTAADRAESPSQVVNIAENLFLGITPKTPGAGVAGIRAASNTSQGEFTSHKLTVSGNTFIECGQYLESNKVGAITLYRRAGLSQIINNRILACHEVAIDVQGSPMTLVMGNTIKGSAPGNDAAAIAVTNRDKDKTSPRCIVRANNVYDWNGIALACDQRPDYPSSDLLVQGNIFSNVSQFVLIENFQDTLRIENNLFDTAHQTEGRVNRQAVSIAGHGERNNTRSAQVAVCNNTIKNTGNSSVFIRGIAGEVRVEGNTFDNIGAEGCQLTQIEGVTSISNNSFRNVAGKFVNANGVQVTRIMGNTLEGSSDHPGERSVSVKNARGEVFFTENILRNAGPVEVVEFDTIEGQLVESNNVYPPGASVRMRRINQTESKGRRK